VVGVTRHGERGLPKNLNASVLNDLMKTVDGRYTIGLTTAVMPVPNTEASNAINSAEDMIIANQKVETPNQILARLARLQKASTTKMRR